MHAQAGGEGTVEPGDIANIDKAIRDAGGPTPLPGPDDMDDARNGDNDGDSDGDSIIFPDLDLSEYDFANDEFYQLMDRVQQFVDEHLPLR